MVTDLPAVIKGTEATPELDEETLASLTDVDAARPATGLSERELADLLANGSPEEIRAAMPRMSPEMRKIAAAVLVSAILTEANDSGTERPKQTKHRSPATRSRAWQGRACRGARYYRLHSAIAHLERRGSGAASVSSHPVRWTTRFRKDFAR